MLKIVVSENLFDGDDSKIKFVQDFITSFILQLGGELKLYVQDDLLFHEKEYWIPKYSLIGFPLIIIGMLVNMFIELYSISETAFAELSLMTLPILLPLSDNIMTSLTASIMFPFVLILFSYAGIKIIIDTKNRHQIYSLYHKMFLDKEFKNQFKKSLAK